MNNIRQIAKSSPSGYAAGRIRCTYVNAYTADGSLLFAFNKPQGSGALNLAPVITKGKIITNPNSPVYGLVESELSQAGYKEMQDVVGGKGAGKYPSQFWRFFQKKFNGEVLPRDFHAIQVYVKEDAIDTDPAPKEEVPPVGNWPLFAGLALILLSKTRK